AATMASMAEALGMTLPGNAAIPAPDSRRLALAELSGRRAVELAQAGGPRPSEILTAKAFDNAIRGDMAIGGSTNAIIHLVALAGRAGVPLPPTRFDDLSGNLCPDGALLKQSAASPHLLTHRGRAVVFEDHDDLHRRIDDPGLPIDENSVLVLKHVGPRGAPGMPEWGAAPIPARLLKRGVKDMVRISDARMS